MTDNDQNSLNSAKEMKLAVSLRRRFRSRLITLVLLIPVIALIVGWKSYGKMQTSGKAKEQLVQLVSSCSSYLKDKQAFTELINEAHKVSFDNSYSFGARRGSARFDADKYASIAMALMIERAQSQGRNDLAAELERNRAERNIPKVNVRSR